MFMSTWVCMQACVGTHISRWIIVSPTPVKERIRTLNVNDDDDNDDEIYHHHNHHHYFRLLSLFSLGSGWTHDDPFPTHLIYCLFLGVYTNIYI